MAKTRKQVAAHDPPLMPQVGDKVKPGNSELIYEIDHVSQDGSEVNLYIPGTNLQRFRVRPDALTFIERKPPAKTSNPFTTPEPALDADEVLERIAAVQRENLERSAADIDILKSYLKTQGAPKDAISVLESLTVEQHKSWKTAVKKIEELLGE